MKLTIGFSFYFHYMLIEKNVDDYFFLITENPSKLFLIIYRKKNLLDKILVLLKFFPLFESYFTIEDIRTIMAL